MNRRFAVAVTSVALAFLGWSAIAADQPTDERSGSTQQNGAQDDNQKKGADPTTPPIHVGRVTHRKGASTVNEPSRSPGEVYVRMDPSFSKYVDLSLLTDAVAQVDASLLTDVALSLAEGERVLVRTHRSGLTADQLIARAARLAVALNDKSTLDRIMKAASTCNKPQWSNLLKETREFGGVSRDGPSVAIGKIDVRAIELTREVQHACHLAQMTGDKSELERLKKAIEASKADPTVMSYLMDLIGNCIKSLPEKPDSTDKILAEFAAPSRGYAWQWEGIHSGFVVTPDTNVSTFDDPVAQQRFDKYHCWFENDTPDIVGFVLSGQSHRLMPGQGSWFWLCAPVGTAPWIHIYQLNNGGYRPFSLRQMGVYAFRVNPQSGQIENYYK
jgi:hypothetical protein